MKQTYRRKLIIQVCISLLLLFFLLAQIKPSQLREICSTISIPLAIGIAGLLIPSILVRALRWKLLFEDEFHRINILESTQLLFVGLFLNLFLPASSGDIAKSYFGYKWSGVKERMLSVSLLDKLIALGSIALLGIPFGLYRHDLVYVILSLVVLVPVVLFVIVSRLCTAGMLHRCLKKLNEWALKKLDLLAVVEQTRISFKCLCGAVILSVLGWAVTYFQMYSCFQFVSPEISMTFVLTVAPLITLARLFPFALSGLGSDEMVLYYIFQTQGLTLEQTLTAALLFRLIVIVLPGVPGLWIVFMKRKLKSVNRLGQIGEYQ